MTQPNPSATGDAKQERLKRGGRVSLETRRQFRGTVVEASEERVVVAFPGTEGLDKQLADAGASEVHLVFRVGHRAGPPDVSVVVFLNTPDARPDTPITGGFVGSIAFFEHQGHAEHGQGPSPFRLPAMAALKQVGGPEAVTATFVPVAFPARGSIPQVLDVSAALHLVRSTVERGK
jgi:hypothetical protein